MPEKEGFRNPIPNSRRQREEDEGLPSKRLKDDILFEAYGIKGAHSTKQRVEILYESFNLGAEEISEILEIGLDKIQPYCDQIEQAITDAGKEASPAEKARQRGKFILVLEKNLGHLQNAFNQTKDPTIAPHITRITERLMKLRGVEDEQKKDDGPAFSTELEKKIAELPAEKIAELRAKLGVLPGGSSL